MASVREANKISKPDPPMNRPRGIGESSTDCGTDSHTLQSVQYKYPTLSWKPSLMELLATASSLFDIYSRGIPRKRKRRAGKAKGAIETKHTM